ncbi:MAG: acylphosphatase [Bacteroidales bacterium]|nr:acylphosphatase [Bacteroidales bacterium]
MKRSVIIKVIGKVQNVGFRFYAHKTAKTLNINGFVSNKVDGTVYIEAEGEEKDIEQFIDWCRIGPSWARVDNVQIQDSVVCGYNDFIIN